VIESESITRRRPAERAPELLEGICELTLEARDLDRVAAFYREAFGCRTIKHDEDRIWLAAGSRTRLGIWAPGPKEFGDRGGRHVHFALSSSPGGLDRLVERLRERSTCAGPSSTPAATGPSTWRIPRATWWRCGTSSTARTAPAQA
jgi:hypothetical protein